MKTLEKGFANFVQYLVDEELWLLLLPIAILLGILALPITCFSFVYDLIHDIFLIARNNNEKI